MKTYCGVIMNLCISFKDVLKEMLAKVAQKKFTEMHQQEGCRGKTDSTFFIINFPVSTIRVPLCI